MPILAALHGYIIAIPLGIVAAFTKAIITIRRERRQARTPSDPSLPETAER